MSFDIEKAIKYPFEDPNWKSKVGVYIAIQIVLSLVVTALNTLTNFVATGTSSLDASSLSQYDASSLNISSFDTATILTTFMPFFLMILVATISFPIQLYLSGYMNKTLRNIKNGREFPVAEHNNFWDKIKLWFDVAVVAAGPFLINAIVFTIVAIPLIFMYTQLYFGLGEPVDTTLLIVTLVTSFFAIVILIASSILTSALVYPAMLFIYFKTGSRSKAYVVSDVVTVIKAGWKQFLLITLINMGIGSVIGSIGLFLCFASFIVKPLLSTVQNFMNVHFLGTVFREMENDGVLFDSGALRGEI